MTTLENESQYPVTCGLEVHQQLDTGKLFDRKPTILQDDPTPDFIFTRKLHAVASEFGKVDQAAADAAQKNQTFVYQGFHESTGLIGTDEEPPAPIDEDALHVALQVALVGKADVLDQLIAMRKTVVDGSNTSGFQRTVQIAMGGELVLKGGKIIRLQGLALEEDSARPIERDEKKVVYRLDRLGFPLIELSTMPDIHTPAEAKETAYKMGELMRITGKVKRGLGTIRQDLNISIPHGARVELKGVQEVDLIDVFVEREMARQKKLLEVKDILIQKGLSKEMIESQGIVDVSPIFEKTQSEMIQIAQKRKDAIIGMRLPHMHGIMGTEIQPTRRVGSEIASYVKAKTGLRGLLHGDELPKYGITEEEVNQVREKLCCKEEDSFVIVVCPEEKGHFAMHVIKQRASHLLEGVPEETRNALEGGNSEYSRPLAGAHRMYPETDIPEMTVDQSLLESIQKNLPRWGDERKAFYMKKGLSEKLAEEMKIDNHARFYTALINKGYDPTTAATLLLSNLNVAYKENPHATYSEEQLENLLAAEKNKLLMREQFPLILNAWAKHPHDSLSEIMTHLKIEKTDDSEVEKIVAQIVEKNQHLIIARGMQAQSALMGLCMQALRGKAQGYFIAQALEKEMKKRMGK